MKFGLLKHQPGMKSPGKYMIGLPMKTLLVFAFFFGTTFSGMSQYVRDSTRTEKNNSTEAKEEDHSFASKLVPGGSLALDFGNPWYLDISPNLGVQINERLVGGLGIIYNAYGQTIYGIKYKYERYGASAFARYRMFDTFFANAEIDIVNVPDEYSLEGNKVWTVNPMLGASYIVPFGIRGGLQASLLYNLNYAENLSPYPSPLIWRIGFFL
jgi:hypothetical protein